MSTGRCYAIPISDNQLCLSDDHAADIQLLLNDVSDVTIGRDLTVCLTPHTSALLNDKLFVADGLQHFIIA